MPNQDCGDRFEAAMFALYETWKTELGDCSWRANRFLQGLRRRGAIPYAEYLVAKPGGSDGLDRLAACCRLDASVECLVLARQYGGLFDPVVRSRARAHLSKYRVPRSALPLEPYGLPCA